MTFPQYTVAANRLNLRAAPSTAAAVLAVLDHGTVIQKLDGSDAAQWWEVLAGQMRGYLARRFLLPVSQGAIPVIPGINDVLWNLTQAAVGRVTYRLGAKDSRSGAIDCSGWVGEISRKAFDTVNRMAGEVVFDDGDCQAFDTHSDGIVCAVERRTGMILTGPQVTATALRPGMLVGVDFGLAGFEAGQPPRHYGIDHIVQVVRDPASGALQITQSSSSGRGVNFLPLANWLAGLAQRGLISAGKVFAVDPFAMADPYTAYLAAPAPSPASPIPPAPAPPSLDDEPELRPPPPVEVEERAPLTLAFEQERSLFYARANGGERFFVGSSVDYRDDMARVGLHQGAKGQAWITACGLYDRHALAGQDGIGPWAHFLWPTVMAESAGLYGRLNTYDRASFTFGIMQFAAHTPGKNLIRLFRRLLALPTAPEYFPELALRPVGGIACVHLQRPDQSWVDLELARDVRRPNGKIEAQLADFMAYLNPDPTEVGASELKAAARLMLWCTREPMARQAQVLEAVATVKANLAQAATRMPAFDPVRDWEQALWVADILHQGRGTYSAIEAALGSAERLSEIGASVYGERKTTVKAHIQQLKADSSLDGWMAAMAGELSA